MWGRCVYTCVYTYIFVGVHRVHTYVYVDIHIFLIIYLLNLSLPSGLHNQDPNLIPRRPSHECIERTHHPLSDSLSQKASVALHSSKSWNPATLPQGTLQPYFIFLQELKLLWISPVFLSFS